MMNREKLFLDLLDNDDPSLREIYLSNFSLERPSESILECIMGIASDDPARRVREAAVKILARFWPRRIIVDLFRRLCFDGDVETAAATIKALHSCDDQLSYQLLCDLYHKRKDFQIKAAVLVGLGRRPYPQVKEFLADYFTRDQDEFIRAMTVTTLGRAGDPEVVEHLLRATRDPDHRVRANAIESLARFPGHVEESVLLDALEDSHHRVQVAALKALHKSGWSGVSGKLDEMRTSPTDLVRASVNHFLQEVEGLMAATGSAEHKPIIN